VSERSRLPLNDPERRPERAGEIEPRPPRTRPEDLDRELGRLAIERTRQRDAEVAGRVGREAVRDQVRLEQREERER